MKLSALYRNKNEPPHDIFVLITIFSKEGPGKSAEPLLYVYTMFRLLLSAKSDSDVVFCLQSYQGLIISQHGYLQPGN